MTTGPSRSRLIAICVAGAIALAIPSAAAAGTITQTFDADNGGWEACQSIGDCAGATHAPAGGNPGGRIHATDTDADPEFFFFQRTGLPIGPANYGGSLSFDYQSETSPDALGATTVFLFDDPDTFLAHGFQPVDATTWQHFSLPLSEAGWNYSSGGNPGTPATKAQFESALAGVDRVEIYADVVNLTTDTYGLDNFVLSDGPPPTGAPPPPGITPTGQRAAALKKCAKIKNKKKKKKCKKRARKLPV